jgi:hypothetical protein
LVAVVELGRDRSAALSATCVALASSPPRRQRTYPTDHSLRL